MMKLRLNQDGITITELSIVIAMAGFIAVLLGSITITFYTAVLKSDVEARMVVDSQIILRDIVDELRLSSSVTSTNSIPDANGPAGGWNTSSTDAILIMQTPVLDPYGEFVIDSLTGEPYVNELVYFASDGQLYRRVLENTEAPTNKRPGTCPEAAVGTGGCTRADADFSADYENMSFVFYDQDDNITTVIEDARSIDMTIDLNRNVLGDNINIQNSIRATLRNDI